MDWQARKTEANKDISILDRARDTCAARAGTAATDAEGRFWGRLGDVLLEAQGLLVGVAERAEKRQL